MLVVPGRPRSGRICRQGETLSVGPSTIRGRSFLERGFIHPHRTPRSPGGELAIAAAHQQVVSGSTEAVVGDALMHLHGARPRTHANCSLTASEPDKPREEWRGVGRCCVFEYRTPTCSVFDEEASNCQIRSDRVSRGYRLVPVFFFPSFGHFRAHISRS